MANISEKMAVMHEVGDNVSAKLVEYNSMVHDGASLAELNKKLDEAQQLVNEYTGHAREVFFMQCADAENPIMEAVTRLTYETISIKDEKVEGSLVPKKVVVDKEVQVDLLKLHDYIDGGIGADRNWPLLVEQFNLQMTLQCAIDLGIDPKEINDSYAMKKLSREFSLGKNPCSKTSMLKTLTTVVQAMIGEDYKPLSHDVQFLLRVYSKKSRKALTVTCANHKYLRGYLTEICHRIVTNKVYSIDYKAMKAK